MSNTFVRWLGENDIELLRRLNIIFLESVSSGWRSYLTMRMRRISSISRSIDSSILVPSISWKTFKICNILWDIPNLTKISKVVLINIINLMMILIKFKSTIFNAFTNMLGALSLSSSSSGKRVDFWMQIYSIASNDNLIKYGFPV